MDASDAWRGKSLGNSDSEDNKGGVSGSWECEMGHWSVGARKYPAIRGFI